jgi:hypothetical protein
VANLSDKASQVRGYFGVGEEHRGEAIKNFVVKGVLEEGDKGLVFKTRLIGDILPFREELEGRLIALLEVHELGLSCALLVDIPVSLL